MENNIKNEKLFSNSTIVIENRGILKITGVEKIFETNENKIVLKVCGSTLNILGLNLSVEKLDVNSGNLELIGKIDEIKYSDKNLNKTNLIKRIFK